MRVRTAIRERCRVGDVVCDKVSHATHKVIRASRNEHRQQLHAHHNVTLPKATHRRAVRAIAHCARAVLHGEWVGEPEMAAPAR